MSDKTGIEWTNSTWNPLVGCEHVSPGCDNCYAAREASGRLAHLPAYAGLARGGRFTGQVRPLPERLDQPLRWRKPRMIFANSTSDLFHKDVPADYIAQVFAVMALASRHTFQVLTKRHARIRALLSDPDFPLAVADHATDLMGSRAWQQWQLNDSVASGWTSSPAADGGNLWHPPWPLPNVWLGVSVEDDPRARLRIDYLVRTPAAVRFLSCEPLLGPVNLRCWLSDPADIDGACWPPSNARERTFDWVIAGGESGPAARPMHPDWARRIRDDCQAAGIPFFFKQFGEYLPVAIEDDPTMFGGRSYANPAGGRSSPVLRELGGPFRPGKTRLMEPGDRTGAGVMLDRDTFALKVGKRKAGNHLDGRTWEQFPDPAGAAA